MTDKQLRSLSKTQLFTLLHQQELEIERLTAENKKLTEQHFDLQQAGSIAEASVTVSGIIQAAQNAADVYLDSIRRIESDKLDAVAKLEEDAKARAVWFAEKRNAESKAQIEQLVRDMLRNFDSQLNCMATIKGELFELISANNLRHLISDGGRDEQRAEI